MKPVLEPAPSPPPFWPFIILGFFVKGGLLFLSSVYTWGVHTPRQLVVISEEHQ